MRSSKDRTIQKKRVNKANKIAKTERSRKQRIANKHRREEIHAIDPDMKVIILNQKTFDEHGTEIEVMNGKIRAITPVVEETEDTKYIEEQKRAQPYIDKEMGIFKQISTDFDSAVEEYKEVVDVVEKIETRNKSAFRRLTDKLRGD
tara:strand:- start:109 stop:549 length:441 start_codon:yes stop_codon:yes gene_type:complete